MQTTWPTTTLVHLPIHAPWLNQVEIYFSILQRKAISPNDFADLDHLAERIMSFQDRYNTHRDTLRLDLHPRPTSTPSSSASTSTRHNPDELTTVTTSPYRAAILGGSLFGSGVERPCTATRPVR